MVLLKSQTKLKDTRGRLTAYGYSCGYATYHKYSTLLKDEYSNFYIVRGWKQGEYNTFYTKQIREARKVLVKKEWN
jgi:hypothetical protein